VDKQDHAIRQYKEKITNFSSKTASSRQYVSMKRIKPQKRHKRSLWHTAFVEAVPAYGWLTEFRGRRYAPPYPETPAMSNKKAGGKR
jgi:hypothetical protein